MLRNLINTKIFLLLCFLLAFVRADFNSKPWINDLNKAKQIAAQEQKPILVQFTKTGCGPCNNFKNSFQGNDEELFDKLSENFVLVHFLDNAGSQYKDLAPDGAYFPRTIFLDQNGQVDSSIMNQLRLGGADPSTVSYKYFYNSLSVLNNGIRSAIEQIRN